MLQQKMKQHLKLKLDRCKGIYYPYHTVKEIDLMINEFNINKDDLTIIIDDSLESITQYNLKWGKNSTWLIENN